jgi:hypothetical protein
VADLLSCGQIDRLAGGAIGCGPLAGMIFRRKAIQPNVPGTAKAKFELCALLLLSLLVASA